MLAALLETARRPRCRGRADACVAGVSAFMKRKAEDPANKDVMAQAIRAVTGSSLRLAYELRADGARCPPPRRRAADALRRRPCEAIHGRVRRGGTSSGA